MANINAQDLLSVRDMVVCITGGGTGIGRMMTTAFATNGAKRVYILGRRREKLDETASLAPHIIVPVVCDVTSNPSLLEAAERIEKETGYLNLLCCNSGTMPPALEAKSGAPLHEYRQACLASDPSEWAQTFATNTTSIFYTTFAFLALLDAGNKGENCSPGRKSQVLVTTSIAGYSRLPGTLGAYPASKAAATHLIKQLAGSLVPYSIRVNGLAPGLFPSELAAGIIAMGGKGEKEATEEGAFEKNFVPAERLGKAEDMVGTVLYMASAAGAYLNGNITVLDGGRITQLPATY
ncbi:hypothetical protein LTR62_007577 [Meristemomyces frigidus]|uniref:Uncharacterized protein n=1 Tax=Meristemomyces frigidus TaxID=1508187 RepID=A0AAN7YDJ4_9PEZI|nr:hypothetical protein LTR62_007577 [Meristemomyces frigidus]